MFVGCRAELLMPVLTPQVQFSVMSVLDRALFLERILYELGYVRMAIGALNVVSQ